jgi:hypothetical protein
MRGKKIISEALVDLVVLVPTFVSRQLCVIFVSEKTLGLECNLLLTISPKHTKDYIVGRVPTQVPPTLCVQNTPSPTHLIDKIALGSYNNNAYKILKNLKNFKYL